MEISDEVVRLYLNNNHHRDRRYGRKLSGMGTICSIWRGGHCQELPWSSSGADQWLVLGSI
eukprot:scaffold156847_cov66-Attheya_sp.AAC.4